MTKKRKPGMDVREVVNTIIKACDTPRIVDTGDRLITGEWDRDWMRRIS